MATRYCDFTLGTGSGDGSFANPYKTRAEVQSASTGFASGDKVLFKCGETWNDSGTFELLWASPYIGAYYESAGSPVEGISGTEPYFNGQYDPLNPPGSTVTPPTPPTCHDSGYTPNILTNVDDATITDIRVWNAQVGIRSNAHRTTIDNCDIREIYRNAILLWKNPIRSGSIVKNCYMYHSVRKRPDCWKFNGWPSNLNIQQDDVLAENNVIETSFGEGIGSYYDNSIIRNNLVYNCFAIQIYIGGDSTTLKGDGHQVYNNLVIGGRNDETHRYNTGKGYCGGGIVINHESSTVSIDLSNYKIWNNLVADCIEGIAIYTGGAAGYTIDQLYIYHNTVIGNYRNWGKNTADTDPTITNGFLMNNIFAKGGNTECNMTGNPPSDVTCDYNLWEVLPQANAQGPNDKLGDPLIEDGNSITTATSISGFTENNFKLTASSPAINGCQVILGYSSDYFGNSRGTPGLSCDMGAIEYSGSLAFLWRRRRA